MNLVMDLSSNGDDIGDDISGVLVMARSLINQAKTLLADDIGFEKIAQGFETSAKIAFDHLHAISQKFDFNPIDREPMVHSAMTALSAM
jgi:chaperonin GroEL (HSP60 family)